MLTKHFKKYAHQNKFKLLIKLWKIIFKNVPIFLNKAIHKLPIIQYVTGPGLLYAVAQNHLIFWNISIITSALFIL